MIKASAQLDLREWERAIGKLKEAYKRRTLPQIINRSAGSIALKALVGTKHSVADKIRDYFRRVVGVSIKTISRGKNKGQLKTKIDRENNPVAYASYLKRHPEMRGKGEELRKAVNNFVNRSIASAHYLQHGWKEVIDLFRPWMKSRNFGTFKHKSGKRKLGTGTPAPAANVSLVTEASIFNRAVIGHEKMRPHMQDALNRAVREETSQLKAAAEKALLADIKAVGG